MTPSMNSKPQTLKSKLLDETRVLNHFDLRDGRWEELFPAANWDVEQITDKAALINGEWIPKSHMAIDFDENLHVTGWYINQRERNYR